MPCAESPRPCVSLFWFHFPCARCIAPLPAKRHNPHGSHEPSNADSPCVPHADRRIAGAVGLARSLKRTSPPIAARRAAVSFNPFFVSCPRPPVAGRFASIVRGQDTKNPKHFYSKDLLARSPAGGGYSGARIFGLTTNSSRAFRPLDGRGRPRGGRTTASTTDPSPAGRGQVRAKRIPEAIFDRDCAIYFRLPSRRGGR